MRGLEKHRVGRGELLDVIVHLSAPSYIDLPSSPSSAPMTRGWKRGNEKETNGGLTRHFVWEEIKTGI